MNDVNKFKLGLFVVCSLLIFLAIIACLGCFDAFRAKAYVMTMVQESVQGLNNGSAVKYKGVPIGTVTDITINTAGKQIRVDMQIDLSKFKTEEVGGPNRDDITRDEFYSYLRKEIMEGLRSRIEPDGITGMKYIELEFPEDAKPVDPALIGFSKYDDFYIPSVPSLMKDLRTGLTNLLTQFESIDYKGISTRIETTLDTVNQFIVDPKLKNTLDNVNSVSNELNQSVTTINKSLTPERVEGIITRFSGTIGAFDSLSKEVHQILLDADVPNTAATMREAFKNFSQSNHVFRENMMKFSEGLDAMIELIQYLDSDPSSLLSGKRKGGFSRLTEKEENPSIGK